MGYLTFPPPGSHFPPPYRWSGKFGKDQSSQTDRFGNFGNFGIDLTNFHEVSERCCARASLDWSGQWNRAITAYVYRGA